LTVAGQAGVARVIDILRDEMLVTMRQIGRPTIDALTRDVILDAGAP
jgi:isopentenyl diphosphate isomerase/L-lactate dehydrogenase-like FMN-dependent dehydrogenase